MREIKFRAWDKTNEKWLHRPTFYIHCDGKINTWEVGEEDKYLSEYHDDLVLMQFTGLLDKKGVEIWEGDILKTRIMYDYDLFSEDIIKAVEFVGGQFNPMRETKMTKYRILPLYYDFEVIGNVFENPELLETNNET